MFAAAMCMIAKTAAHGVLGCGELLIERDWYELGD
jgi:hypothetical protein